MDAAIGRLQVRVTVAPTREMKRREQPATKAPDLAERAYRRFLREHECAGERERWILRSRFPF
jgi:hypothetical protein